MKKILSLFACILLMQFSWAQVNVTEQKAKWIEGEQNSLAIEVGNNVKLVEEALEIKLKEEGLKISSKSGFTICKAQTWAKISKNTMDYYFKVTKIDKEKSVVNLFISTGYNNFLTSESNKDEIAAAKEFLKTLIVDTKKLELANAIKEQESKIADANKDQEKLLKRKADMEKDIEDLKKKITDNVAEQDAKAKEIENLKLQLAELQGKIDALK